MDISRVCVVCGRDVFVYTDDFRSQLACFTCGAAIVLPATGFDDFENRDRVEPPSLLLNGHATPLPRVLETSIDDLSTSLRSFDLPPPLFRMVREFCHLYLQQGTARITHPALFIRLIAHYIAWHLGFFRPLFTFWLAGLPRKKYPTITILESKLRQRLLDDDIIGTAHLFQSSFDFDGYLLHQLAPSARNPYAAVATLRRQDAYTATFTPNAVLLSPQIPPTNGTVDTPAVTESIPSARPAPRTVESRVGPPSDSRTKVGGPRRPGFGRHQLRQARPRGTMA